MRRHGIERAVCPRPLRFMGGLSLVELMVALVLGLMLILAAGNIFISNKQTYRTVENLSRIQESLRFAFELMARDARMAGAIRCGYTSDVANVLNGAAGALSWGEAVKGYGASDTIAFPAVSACGDTPTAGCRVAGTEAVYFANAASDVVNTTVVSHDLANAKMTLGDAGEIQQGDILLVCKPTRAAIFQVTGVDTGEVITHEVGNGHDEHHHGAGEDDHHADADGPGNVTTCLSYPLDLSGSSCTDFTGAEVARLSQQIWYIGNNGRGGSSLYRRDGTGNAEEIVPDVDDLELGFLSDTGTAYVDVASITDWSTVRGVRIRLMSRSNDKVGTDSNEISRDYTFTVSLRNRLR